MTQWYRISGDEVIMTLHITPNAPKSRVMGLYGDAMKIAIKALPEDGEANAELVRFLAEQCQLLKRDVDIRQGKTSQRKKVSVPLTPLVEMFIKKV